MQVWNITCNCGHDTDYLTLRSAKSAAKTHKRCNDDGKVFIDQVNNDPDAFDDYQTGKTVVV